MNQEKIKSYTDFIFSFFQDCKVGQGLFFNSIRFSAEKKFDRKQLNEFFFIFNILLGNQYLSIDNEGKQFVKLTQQGFDCLYGDEGLIPLISLNDSLYNEQKKNDEIYNELWNYIGKEDDLFYVNGAMFYNTIKPFLNKLPPTYSVYINDLREQKKSTSRVSWYRELFLHLQKEDINPFLGELSKNINSEIKKQIQGLDANDVAIETVSFFSKEPEATASFISAELTKEPTSEITPQKNKKAEAKSSKNKVNTVWKILGGTGVLAIFGVILFFQQISGYTIKDFVEGHRTEKESQDVPVDDPMKPSTKEEDQLSPENEQKTIKAENSNSARTDNSIIRSQDTPLGDKENNSAIMTNVKIEGMGESHSQIDSITAWNKAKEEAIRDLYLQSKDSIPYKIDYIQSFSKHRKSPNDGIYDAKVVVFGYVKETR